MDVEDHLSSGLWSIDLEPRDTQQANEQLDIHGDDEVSINEQFIAATPEITEPSKALQFAKREKRWEVLKEDIHRLYVEEGKTLPATMAAIQKMCEFTASPRTWKTKIKEWGFDKNVSKKDMTFVVAKANQRTMEGKETVFYYRGLEITPSKIKNFRRRQKTTGPSIGSLQDPATPYFITYGTPKLDELDSTIVDERRVDYHERDDPLDESGSVVRSKNSKSDYDLASLETISAQPHMSPELSGTSFGNDLLLARCNQLLRSWVQTKIEEYLLLLLLENFHFEGILIDMDKSIDPSNLTLEFSLKRWIQHENKDICARCMSSTDESLCIGGILASAEITNQRINNCQERLLDFLEQDPVEHECLFTTIRTYSNLLKLYAIQCGDRHPSTCRFKVALVQFYLRHRQHNLSSLLSEVESFLTTTITNAREVKDPYLQFKWQVILAGCHVRKNRFREAINILLGYSFTDYLTMNSAVVSRIKRFDAQILCMHPDRPEVESKLMSSLASFSDESPYRNPILCRRSIAESINRVSKLVEKKPSVRFWSNKDHFNLRTEIATIAGIISKLGFDHEAQSLFRTLINAADPEDINTEEVMDLWNVKIYTHVLHYVHGIDSNFTKEQFKEKKALCSSLMHQAANFFTTNYLKGNMVHGTVVEKFNELQDMFAGLSPIESFSEGDRSGRIGDLQSQEESRTELFPQMALSLWSDWDKNDGLEDLHIDGFSGFSELPQNDPNIILSLPVVPTVAWNESGELEDVIAPLERIAAASTSSGYQASRSKGSIISGSRMSTNSTSSGMKSIKYGVTYSDGSVMSLDLTELFP